MPFPSQTFSQYNTPNMSPAQFILHAPTCLWRWNRQCVPKRRHIKFRRRGITQKKAYNIQDTAKVWNQEPCYPFNLRLEFSSERCGCDWGWEKAPQIGIRTPNHTDSNEETNYLQVTITFLLTENVFTKVIFLRCRDKAQKRRIQIWIWNWSLIKTVYHFAMKEDKKNIHGCW